jgi:purine-cytosine permease-like protein
MLNKIKRYSGILWIALGPLSLFYLITTALQEIAKKPIIDTIIQWSVFVVVFIPIVAGIVLFGYFAFKGEYDQLPRSSGDLK